MGSKSVPLTKVEVKLLIDLVDAHAIITNKATNATNNKLKDVAWHKITKQFNASVSTGPRTLEQLRLKWENLKKAARKRAKSIRTIKTGGGKAEYIPPNDALDRVASILGSTCKGFPAQFGGDAEELITITETCQPISSLMGVGDSRHGVMEEGGGVEVMDNECDVVVECGGVINQAVIKGPDPDPTLVNSKLDYIPRDNKIFMSGHRKWSTGKLRLTENNNGISERNKIIAEYYSIKKRKLELDIEEKLLNNIKIKTELDKLSLENEKLKLELDLLKKK